jgi:hypothetical protein
LIIIVFYLKSESNAKPLCALCHCDGNNNALGLTDLCSFETTSNSNSNIKSLTLLRDELYKNINRDELINQDEFKAIDRFKQFFKKYLIEKKIFYCVLFCSSSHMIFLYFFFLN